MITGDLVHEVQEASGKLDKAERLTERLRKLELAIEVKPGKIYQEKS